MNVTTQKKALKATLPDGEIITRTTHNYQYVVAVFVQRGYWFEKEGPHWGFTLWTTRLDLAEKESRRVGKLFQGETRILSVSE